LAFVFARVLRLNLSATDAIADYLCLPPQLADAAPSSMSPDRDKDSRLAIPRHLSACHDPMRAHPAGTVDHKLGVHQNL
jgi:hypothetical protein